MNTRSKGPWTFVPEGEANGDFGNGKYAGRGGFVDADGEPVCWFGDCSHYSPTEGWAPCYADAMLMAAAPDMLAALIDIIENGWNCESISAATLAIAKANGETT